MGSRWYVMRTKPRSESLAVQEIMQQNLDAFCPMITTDRINRYNNPKPLFPGYVFMRMDLEINDWPELTTWHHVIGLLHFDGEPPSLSDDTIHEINIRCQSLNEDGGIWDRYNPGDWVQIISSTIPGVAQVLEDGKSYGSPVRVLLNLFERLVPVKISRADLLPLEESIEKNHAPRRTRGKGRWIQGFGPRAMNAQ